MSDAMRDTDPTFPAWWGQLNEEMAERGLPSAVLAQAEEAHGYGLAPHEAALFIATGERPTRAESAGVDEDTLYFGDVPRGWDRIEAGEEEPPLVGPPPVAQTLAQRWIGDRKAQAEASAYYSPYCAVQVVGLDDTAELEFPDGSVASCVDGGPWVAEPLPADVRAAALAAEAPAPLVPMTLVPPTIEFAPGDLARLQTAVGYFIRTAPARELLTMGDLGEWDALAAAIEACRQKGGI